MFSPCRDYCYVRLGKQYTEECDNTCEYAKTIKELNESLKNASVIIQEYEEYFTHFNESLNKTGEIISEMKTVTDERKKLQTETIELLNKMLKV